MAQSANDRRRINGPEESFPPVFDDDDDDDEDIKLKTQRSRAPGDIRPICWCPVSALLSNGAEFLTVLQPGLISQANGSAYIETEKTKIACAVYVEATLAFIRRTFSKYRHRYGPRQSKTTTYSEKGRLNVEVKFTPFSCTRRRAPMRVSNT
jgi:exosome complex component MTR3